MRVVSQMIFCVTFLQIPSFLSPGKLTWVFQRLRFMSAVLFSGQWLLPTWGASKSKSLRSIHINHELQCYRIAAWKGHTDLSQCHSHWSISTKVAASSNANVKIQMEPGPIPSGYTRGNDDVRYKYSFVQIWKPSSKSQQSCSQKWAIPLKGFGFNNCSLSPPIFQARYHP